MSPLLNHPNLGDIQKYAYLQGVITAVNHENDGEDTARVTVAALDDLAVFNIPIFYHCEPDSVLRDNGALEGASGAFSIDDEVIVRCEILDSTDYRVDRIMGFIGKPKSCIWEPWEPWDGPDYNSLHPWTVGIETENFTSSASIENAYSIPGGGILSQILRIEEFRYFTRKNTREVDTTLKWLSSYEDLKPPVSKPIYLKTLVTNVGLYGRFAWYDYVCFGYYCQWVPRAGYYDYWAYLHVEDTSGNKINLFFAKLMDDIAWEGIDPRFEGNNYDFRTSIGTEVVLTLADYGIVDDIKEVTMYGHVRSEQTTGCLYAPPFVFGCALEMSCRFYLRWDYLKFQ